MALKPFNGANGISVGQITPVEVIDANGNITTSNFTSTGVANLGAVSNVKISNGSSGQVLSTDGTGNLVWISVSSSGALANGTSNVSIPTANGNVNLSVAGNANILVVTGTGANIAGTLNVTSNANVGNIGATNGIFTNVSGNGAGLTAITGANVAGTVANAAYAVSAGTAGTVTTNAQPNITSVGTLSSLNVAGNVTAGNVTTGSGTGGTISGANLISANFFTGTLTSNNQPNITSVGSLTSITVIGNANTGNLGTTTVVATTGNITTINSGLIQNGNSNIAITANGNISFSTAGTANDLVITSTGVNVSGTGNFTGNLVAANLIGPLANGNSNVRIATANGNVTIAAVGNTTMTITGTGANITGTANISGNANVGNLGTSRVLASANITAPQIISNVANGTAPLVVTSTTRVSNLNVATAGTADTANNVYTQTSTNTTVYLLGTAAASNINAPGEKTTGIYANMSNNSITATTFVGTLSGSATSATTAGTVTSNDQPNITSVGTLTSLTVTGNINAGNAIITGNLSINGNVTYVNVDTLAVEDPIINLQTGANGAAPAANSGKDVGTALNYYDTAARIAFMGWDVSNSEFGLASLATITNEVVTFDTYGNLRVGNIIGNGQSLTGINGANVTGTVANATYATSAGSATSATTAGTVTTNAQPNITSVGTLTSLGVNGNITATNITANTGVFTGNGSGLSAIAGANVTGTVANATYATSAGSATSATTASTVTTNAQPNINSVGTLSSLSVTGNANVGNIGATNGVFTNVSGNGNALSALNASNITTGTVNTARLGSGTANANTYLAGDNTWKTIATGSSTSISNGTSNVNIPAANGNIQVSVAGNANVITFTGTNATRGVYELTGFVYQATTAPSNPRPGDQWYNTNNGILFEYLNDGTTSQWVDVGSLPAPVISTANAVAVQANLQTTGTYYPAFISSTSNAFYSLASNTAFSANLANGALIANTFVGTHTGIFANGTSNINIPATNGDVTVSVAGTSNLAVFTSNSVKIQGELVSNSTSQVSTNPTISAGTLVLDLAASSIFNVTLDNNITTLTLNNVNISGTSTSFVLKLTADGTARTVAWPTSFKWPNGTAPTLTSAINKVDVIVAFTDDGGTSWYAFISGQNM